MRIYGAIFLDFYSARMAFNDKGKQSVRSLSPHPNPLPEGEGIK